MGSRPARIVNSTAARGGGAVAAALLLVAPVAASASPEHARAQGTTVAAAGVVYGGLSSQDLPIIIEVSSNRRRIVRVVLALRVACTSGAGATVPDTYVRVPITRRGSFTASFGPQSRTNEDGTTNELEGSMRGRFNRNRTRVSGTWRFKLTERDAAGAVTDTCDVGTIRWRARQ